MRRQQSKFGDGGLHCEVLATLARGRVCFQGVVKRYGQLMWTGGPRSEEVTAKREANEAADNIYRKIYGHVRH